MLFQAGDVDANGIFAVLYIAAVYGLIDFVVTDAQTDAGCKQIQNLQFPLWQSAFIVIKNDCA